MNDNGHDPDTDEYTAAGAMKALGVSRATLDRWLPPGSEGRRLTDPVPGRPAEVRISGEWIRRNLPIPAGEGANRE